ncbi:MAG: hypothetical protein HXY35_17315 [Chloroflexi bacterium]|nr:hypothetical protein [Chloroflexota bacterium]
MPKLDTIYQVSEKAFQNEQERMKNLTDKSEKYVGAIAVIIGFQLLDIDKLKLSGNSACYNWLAVIGLIFLGIAFVSAVISNRVQNYHSYPAGEKFLEILDDDKIDDASATTALTTMYLTALDINRSLNHNRAKLLSLSGNLIALGFTLIVIRYILERLVR